jgi:hypothetical protein
LNSPLVSWIRDHSVLLLAALAVIEGLICLALLRGARHARHEMKAAQAAAIEAARAAALAAPGAIDPEAVLALLRQGHAPTLDNVYAMMRRREAEAAQRIVGPPPKPPARVKKADKSEGPPANTSLSSTEFEERLRQYER